MNAIIKDMRIFDAGRDTLNSADLKYEWISDPDSMEMYKNLNLGTEIERPTRSFAVIGDYVLLVERPQDDFIYVGGMVVGGELSDFHLIKNDRVSAQLALENAFSNLMIESCRKYWEKGNLVADTDIYFVN